MTPETQEKRPNYGQFIMAVILALCGLLWLTSGEISIPTKGIVLVGDQARFASAFWILTTFLIAIYPYLKRLSAESRLGMALTSAGLMAGAATTVLITHHYSQLAGLLSGILATVIFIIPGLFICGISHDNMTKR